MDALEVESVGVSAEESRRKNADAILRERTDLSITATSLAAGREMSKYLVLEFTTIDECELEAVGAKLAESHSDIAYLLDASDTENVHWASVINLDTLSEHDVQWKVAAFSLTEFGKADPTTVPTYISVANRASILRKQDDKFSIAHEAPGSEVAIVDIDAIKASIKSKTPIALSETEQKYLKLDDYDLWCSIKSRVTTRRRNDGDSQTAIALLSRAVACQSEFLELISKFENATGTAIDIEPLGPWLLKLREFEERLIGESQVAVIENLE